MSQLGPTEGSQSGRSAADIVEAGRTLHRAGQLDAAERQYTQALAQDEGCAEAHHLLAVLAGQRGRFAEAISGFKRAIALEGPTAERLYNLAEAYRWSDKFDSALAAYNQALTLDASFFDAYRNCAEMAKEMAARAVGAGNIELAGQLNKLAAHYLLGLGHASLRGGHTDVAEQAYRESLALDPGNADPHNSLGIIALQKHRALEAEALCRRAQALEPRSPLYLNNLGMTLRSQLRIEEAAALFGQAIEIDPSFGEAVANLGERRLRWLHYRADVDAAAIFAAHREWGNAAVASIAAKSGLPGTFENRRNENRPLRIAYVGLDTGSRLSQGFFEPLIAHHDRAVVDTTVYVTAGIPDKRMQRFKDLAGHWRIAILRDAREVAKSMREDGTDIVIDLAGHLPHNRLDIFAYRPAPVAVTWLGYPDTTGLPTIDYRITDDVADPPGADQFHTERLCRLRSGSLVYRPPQEAPDLTRLPAREPGAVTFANFDEPTKLAPEVLRAWKLLLDALPAARLLLLGPEFGEHGFVDRVDAELRAIGIDSTRVEMRPSPDDPDAHLGLYAEVDIALDTFPYNASAPTTCEALWMGVPVIALSGDRPCARVSASLLAQVGLESLLSETPDDYAVCAVELARDLDRLASIRSGMRERMRVSPLMEERGFARRFEAALRDMWREWCRSEA